ncbi:MAG: DNA repair protein RecO [Candidatus Krumholzibacteria bacterium]|nr:DNA repair protein RecO [Candidatus Krumholzibacteria bacterium]
MLLKDEGVVLRSARSGETSKLITFFGRSSGKIKLMAKGALAAKSPFRGALDVGNVLDVVYYHREGRTLCYLKEIYVCSTLAPVRESLSGLASALAVLELLDKVCYWASPEERVVDLVQEYLACTESRDPLYVYLACAYKLLAVLGVNPDFSACAVCGGAIGGGYYHPADGTSLCRQHSFETPNRARLDRRVLEQLATMTAGTLPQLSTREVDANVRKYLGKMIHWTYTFHIQGYVLPQALKLMKKADKM